jgi:hypothetical protein
MGMQRAQRHYHHQQQYNTPYRTLMLIDLKEKAVENKFWRMFDRYDGNGRPEDSSGK